jgi:hypothetical protein
VAGSVQAFRILLILVPLLASGACQRPAHDAARASPQSLEQYPHAVDRFMQLVRKQLSDSDPVSVEQQMMCESERVSRALGAAEAEARILTALDTAYMHRDDSVALQRIGRAMAGRVLGTGDHVCDSLIAAADRTDPIVPVRQPARP